MNATVKLRAAAGVLAALAVFGVSLWLARADDPLQSGSAAVLLTGVVAGAGAFWAAALGAGLTRGLGWARSGTRTTALGSAAVALIGIIDTVRRVSAGRGVPSDVVPNVVFLAGALVVLALVPRPGTAS